MCLLTLHAAIDRQNVGLVWIPNVVSQKKKIESFPELYLTWSQLPALFTTISMSLTLKVSFPLSQDSFTLNGATSLPRGSPLTEDYPRRADRAGTRVLAHFPLDPTTPPPPLPSTRRSHSCSLDPPSLTRPVGT